MAIARNRETAQAIAVGLAAGLLSGFFGVGGGFIMVPLYVLWMQVDQKRAHATSLLAIIPIATTAATSYAIQHEVDWSAVFLVLVGSVFGARYGVHLLGKLPLRTIQLIFAAVLIISAGRLLWSATPHQVFHGFVADVLLAVIGFLAGVMSGMLGVGGGIVIVPALILTSGIDATMARGTSLAVIVGTAISGTRSHVKRGNVDIHLGVISGVAGIPAAIVSSFFGTTASDQLVVTLFCVILVTIAVRMLRSSSH
ncbi:MAG: sulfite exporter TauE/SafE family protein [Actinomycetes bacterium]